MSFDARDFARAVWFTVTDPSEAAERVLRFPAPDRAVWPAVMLVSILNVLLLSLTQLLSPPPPEMAGAMIVFSPFSFTLVVWSLLVGFAFLSAAAGRMLGGQGRFIPMLKLMIWFQIVNLCLGIVQAVFLLVLPPLGGMLGLIILIALFYVLLQFIRVLHGFASLGAAFGTFLFALIGAGMATALLMGVLGLGPTIVAPETLQ